MNAYEPFVFKHHNPDYQRQGLYQVCVSSLFDQNTGTPVNLDIMEKYDMQALGMPGDQLSMVSSRELIDLDMVATSIDKRLQLAFEITKIGYNSNSQLRDKVSDLDSLNRDATILQLIFLVVYAVVWVFLIRSFKNFEI